VRRRRDEKRRIVAALALVALGNRNEAQRLRRAHTSLLALYDERGRELEHLYGRVRDLESELRAVRVRAA
jgi:hypothetical protein